MRIQTHLLLAATLSLASTMTFAQSPAAAPSPDGNPPAPRRWQDIRQRKWNQQQRISHGVADGRLTPAEASSLENQEQSINAEERRMRQADGGHLTAQDRATLRQQQNQLSQQIHQDARNNAVQPPANGPIHDRQRWQQQRIAQGIRDGQLSPREASRLERQEGRLNREENVMRAEDGGRLTAADRRQLDRQQNRLSREIRRERHDGDRR